MSFFIYIYLQVIKISNFDSLLISYEENSE